MPIIGNNYGDTEDGRKGNFDTLVQIKKIKHLIETDHYGV